MNRGPLCDRAVAVIGCGGLGCNVIAHLVGAGIGTLYLCDFDTVDKENLNRQFLYKYEDVGKKKAVLAAAFATAYHPACKPIPVDRKIVDENDLGFAAACDLIVLAVDNNKARTVAEKFCVSHGIPLVNGGMRSGYGNAYAYIPAKTPCLGCAGLLSGESSNETVDSGTVGVIGALSAELAVSVLRGDTEAAGNLYVYDNYEISKLRIRSGKDCFCGRNRS